MVMGFEETFAGASEDPPPEAASRAQRSVVSEKAITIVPTVPGFHHAIVGLAQICRTVPH
jgi:hypothetical protein